MGLLTDPGVGQGRITYILVNFHNKLCVLLYIVAIAWFLLLAHDHFNASTYFSENALLPGLVRSDFDEDAAAKTFQSELNVEAKSHPNSMPYAWLAAKFRQLNLDTYTHNFTLNYPLGSGNIKYTGKNVYGILRAPRSSSMEALVLSVPYRPPSSAHPTTVPSVALMMSLAKFFRRQKYWAKDVIFLVTEHEQLGVQAWLEAYHKTSCGHPGVLDHGDMMGRGGAIQAAINLELHSDRISHIDVKVEGLNGQLPNLDLVNLAHRMCSKEGVRHTFKNAEDSHRRDRFNEWMHSLRTLAAMITTQATGVPNGNHGLYHRFGIEAITLEGYEKTGKGSPAVFYQMGRVMEGLFRSLNNLLERFHQSFFFYLLPATDKYISIGMYMPPLGLLCGSLLIKAFALWLKIQIDPEEPPEETEAKTDDKKHTGGGDKKTTEKKSKRELEVVEDEDANENSATDTSLSIVPVGVILLATHTIGMLLLSSPQLFSLLGLQLFELPTDSSIYYGCAAVTFLMLFLPLFSKSNIGASADTCSLLCIVALLEMATLLLAVGMHNFSLALLSAAVYIPPALWMGPSESKLFRRLQQLSWLLLHPLLLLTLVVTVFTAITFPEEPPLALAARSLSATQQALALAVVDCLVYGNWVWSVTAAILVPNWLLFWIVIHSRPGQVAE